MVSGCNVKANFSVPEGLCMISLPRTCLASCTYCKGDKGSK